MDLHQLLDGLGGGVKGVEMYYAESGLVWQSVYANVHSQRVEGGM